MLRLPIRLRRYRVFLACAVVMILGLIRLSRTRDWDYSHVQTFDLGHSTPKEETVPVTPYTPNDAEKPKAVAEPQKPQPTAAAPVASSKTSAASKSAGLNALPPLPSTKPTPTADQSVPKVVIPDRKPKPIGLYDDEDEEEIYPVAPPGRQELPTFSAQPTTIHWQKQPEHFPVPTAELIQLPTGRPLSIPKIQHVFNDETTDAKINREKRQSQVKAEFQKAWNGYKKRAWLHDELSPVSGNFRDPFCGWAATLVDTLDTLWIMGLKSEFEEAAKAVDSIDFTTSPRSDIPLFETTIRYLGGLLAAYDVSEGKYENLLHKAVELAEILMGAFDTPNRMPVLYYRWRPAFASQPHRASTRSNLAELGSLSMEFTRLAQLTKEPKYYDAIARITNALSEWQDEGTKLDGVFPENVDASGCNRTVPVSVPVVQGPAGQDYLASPPGPPVGYTPERPGAVQEPKPKKKPTNSADLAFQVTPGQPSKGKIMDWGKDKQKPAKRGLEAASLSNRAEALNSTLPTRQDPVSQNAAQVQAQREEHCTPQGLTSADGIYGYDKFSMGGGQDSTYEYFTKQHLLLGGLEDKYGKMYKKTADAVRKWMLYRPMLPNDRDVLFSGQVTTSGHPETDLNLTPEVTHLTCFIGGMIGMGAKVFGIQADLEIAKKLTDGCVWAYEATNSGIMPEGATTLACESVEHCPWNETAYWEALDPMGATRDYSVAEYIKAKAQREADEKEARIAAAEGASSIEQSDSGEASTASDEESYTGKSGGAVKKRQLTPEGSNTIPGNAQSAKQNQAKPATSSDKLYDEMSTKAETELEKAPLGFSGEIPLSESATKPQEIIEDPMRPLSHKEYVQSRIRLQQIPPGYVSIQSAKFILRPEAIESVWYMYRITGEQKWADKGWHMFESIINVTSTKYGHSAIFDVMVNDTQQIDEMESFWLAETLKYFYLLYSTPETISLDDWVLNTEAHPFKRPDKV